MAKGVISDYQDEFELYEEEREPVHGEELEGRDMDDEEEEGLDEYEKDGFIVDDIEDEEEDVKEPQKKKKRKKRDEFLLDEDDYTLLEDNNINIHPRKKSKTLRRLKKGLRDTEDEPSGLSDDEEFEGDSDIGEDDMSNFIVDEEVDENGSPMRHKWKVNNKSKRKAPGVSSSALQEAYELFGDPYELILARKKSREKVNKETSNKYLTPEDGKIREVDIPERMQISEDSAPPLDGSSICEESAWIVKQLKNGTVPWLCKKIPSSQSLPIDENAIIRFLELHHVRKLDIPFIAIYGKEECISLLKDLDRSEAGDENWDKNNKAPSLKWHKILCALQDLDRKWLLLQKRKSALQSHYSKRFEVESRRVYDESRLNLNRKLFDSVMRSLREAESEREVDDVDSKFNLHFPPGEAGVDEGKYKRPRRKSMYSAFSKAGLWEVASKFGSSSEQLGLYLIDVVQHEVEDPKETPEELASNFTCAIYDSSDEVLKCARHMAAVEICCEPSIRKHVRSHYLDHAVVSTCPTADGNVTIDSFHQFARVKWLREKPLSQFQDAQWLLIQKAEEEKLIQVMIKLPEEYLTKLVDQFNECYISDSVSRSAQLWNEQRKLILHDAIFRFLLPSMEREARNILTSKAMNWSLMGPYEPKENDISSDDEAAPRVMSCCWGPGKPLTTSKNSEMRSNRLQNNSDLDPYYHEDQRCLQSEHDKAQKQKECAKKHFKQRMIVHPRFQNCTADEAMELLSDRDPGESIIRPSSRGSSYLTLTLKIHDGVYSHKDIVEGGKEHKDMTSLLKIGKTLKIGDDTFEDLDEVMDRYVDPLVTHLKAMLNHRKFRKGTKAEVDELLRTEKAKYPTRIVYGFGISHEHPGSFLLSYLRSTNLHHDYVGIYPTGFRFRKRTFADIDSLVAYFQRHINDA